MSKKLLFIQLCIDNHNRSYRLYNRKKNKIIDNNK